MLELNISFIFHLFFIIIGCQIIIKFLNKLYDNVSEYKKKENEYIDTFNTEKKILKEKIIYLEDNFNANVKDINNIINIILINKPKNDIVLKYTVDNYPLISDEKKQSINNYFIYLLKKID